jgi:hypothetical protein
MKKNREKNNEKEEKAIGSAPLNIDEINLSRFNGLTPISTS